MAQAASTKPAVDDRKRINVLISQESYRKLLQVAGGEKRMGLALETMIEDAARHREGFDKQEALIRLRAARESLERVLDTIEK